MGDLAIFGFGEGGWGLALLEGAAMTLLVSACGLMIGAAIGGLVAWARLSGKRLAGAAGQAYAALFRGLPELLIVYFVYFGTSTLLTETALLFGHEGFVGVPAFAAGALAVGVISGAYQAEVFRAAYLAISRGELEAAVSVGMNRALMARRIILPQVMRFALPGLGNLWQVALKDSIPDLGHRPRRAHAREPGRRRFDPPAFRLLPRRRRPLSRDDGPDDARLRRRRGARDPRHAQGGGLRRRWISISSPKPSSGFSARCRSRFRCGSCRSSSARSSPPA